MPPPTAAKTATADDRTCAEFARAALFPRRMHRDVAHAAHFPALLQLDLLRDKFRTAHDLAVSSVFPRHVVVVRNVSAASQADAIEWNGVPDMYEKDAKFEVIPNQLSVRCTSECDKILMHKKQRSFIGIADPELGGGKEIVLCTDRVLQNDYNNIQYKGVAKELPPKSLSAVEEVLAHELVKVRHAVEEHNNNDNNNNSSSNNYSSPPTTSPTTATAKDDPLAAATIELEAAQAAECYFSRHTYDETKMIKKGSRLQTGYSWLPSTIKKWSMNKCLYAVSVEHLVTRSIQKQDAAKAVQQAMKEYQQENTTTTDNNNNNKPIQ